MGALVDNAGLVWQGFLGTLLLTATGAVGALLLGTVLAAFRVSPVGPLRTLGTLYVEIVRSTPLTLMFFFWVFVVPAFGIVLALEPTYVTWLGITVPTGFIPAFIAVTMYTSSFVCEALRSGINAVGVGQAEAARANGLTFVQVLIHVILPQAWRTAIPPLISVLIALTKNTSVAAGFAFTELTAVSLQLSNRNPTDSVGIVVGIGLCYLAITIPLGIAAGAIERKVAIVR